MLHKVIALNLYILTIKGRIYPLYRQGVQSLFVGGYSFRHKGTGSFRPAHPWYILLTKSKFQTQNKFWNPKFEISNPLMV